MKKTLISIERPEREITGLIQWSEGKSQCSARFNKEWDDAKVLAAFGIPAAKESK